MKHILITISAVLLVGCGVAEAERALFEAAAVGNIEAVKKHLAAGTDVNAKNEKGMTPLMQAAWGGHNEITKLLIAKGADVNAMDDDGITPLDFAIVDKISETADLLRKNGGKTGEELKSDGK